MELGLRLSAAQRFIGSDVPKYIGANNPVRLDAAIAFRHTRPVTAITDTHSSQ